MLKYVIAQYTETSFSYIVSALQRLRLNKFVISQHPRQYLSCFDCQVPVTYVFADLLESFTRLHLCFWGSTSEVNSKCTMQT